MINIFMFPSLELNVLKEPMSCRKVMSPITAVKSLEMPADNIPDIVAIFPSIPLPRLENLGIRFFISCLYSNQMILIALEFPKNKVFEYFMLSRRIFEKSGRVILFELSITFLFRALSSLTNLLISITLEKRPLPRCN